MTVIHKGARMIGWCGIIIIAAVVVVVVVVVVVFVVVFVVAGMDFGGSSSIHNSSSSSLSASASISHGFLGVVVVCTKINQSMNWIELNCYSWLYKSPLTVSPVSVCCLCVGVVCVVVQKRPLSLSLSTTGRVSTINTVAPTKNDKRVQSIGRVQFVEFVCWFVGWFVGLLVCSKTRISVTNCLTLLFPFVLDTNQSIKEWIPCILFWAFFPGLKRLRCGRVIQTVLLLLQCDYYYWWWWSLESNPFYTMQCNAMENVCTVVQLNICNEKETELKASSKLNSGETKR